MTHDATVALPADLMTFTVMAPVPVVNAVIAPVIHCVPGFALSVIDTHCPTAKAFPVCARVSDFDPRPIARLVVLVACVPGLF